jgi:polar amino acid transport system substrate-binding protein
MNTFACCLLAIGIFAAAAPAQAALPRQLRICGDVNEFPPFVYHLRVNGRKTPTMAGFDVEILEQIAATNGRTLHIELLPWARCLLLAKRGEYDIALDGIRTPERERDFIHASSHYALTPLFFYLKEHARPVLANANDLIRYRICSQADYNYSPFGIPDAMLTNRARTIDDAATMLKLGRCNIILSEREVISGNARLGGIDLLSSPEFDSMQPDWLKPIEFHYLVSRAVPYRKELAELLDKGIARLRKSGELERIRSTHVTP